MSELREAREFFGYARERYQVLLRQREGRPREEWTADPILQEYRFCNVFREDDTTTQWVRRTLTHASYGSRLLQAMVIARWFNRVETLERLLPPTNAPAPYFEHNMLYSWDSEEVRVRLGAVSPLVTGAYMIKTPAGINKLEGLIWCIEHVVGRRWVDGCPVSCESKANELLRHGGSLQETTEWLMQFPYIGGFMAYEVATDLRHTPVLASAPDIYSWAHAGPGAARGAGRVVASDPKFFQRGRDQREILQVMRRLLEYSREEVYWPRAWPRWEMREVEHTLCEFDKYRRAQLGEGHPKQRYKPHSDRNTQ